MYTYMYIIDVDVPGPDKQVIAISHNRQHRPSDCGAPERGFIIRPFARLVLRKD